MKIRSAHFSGGLSSFFFDDQAAIKGGAEQDGFVYSGSPRTEGFEAIRQPGESVSVLLVLEDGSVAVGDCAAVQYSGAGGRDALFRASLVVAQLEAELRPWLEGRDVSRFRENSRALDALRMGDRPLHTAIRYGVSQALLDATALAQRCLKAEVLCREFDLPRIAEAVPLFGQTGDDRYHGVDKMILKGVDALPHGLINNVPDKLGHRGEKLLEYVSWIVRRISQLRRQEDYRPTLHIDTYGTIGLIFEQDTARIAAYLARLGEAAGDHPLYVEGPIDAGNRQGQIEALSSLRQALGVAGSRVRIVADEWCNTYEDIVEFCDAHCCDMVQIKTPDLGCVHHVIEAIRYSRAKGMESYQGGTCNETDVSARVCVHLALAARPERMLVKPGMGFDEGMTIVGNEMQRALTIMRTKG
ncbi:MAG: methylaspartate ammonia-lyase [Halieaceae bacterium]|jgi:methylaspartate ammonia-lyase|nr:methylaspartate ammonia-lyase [Halieaceae bacterium]